MLTLKNIKKIPIYLYVFLLTLCSGGCANPGSAWGENDLNSQAYSSPSAAVLTSPTAIPAFTPFLQSSSTVSKTAVAATSPPFPTPSSTSVQTIQLCSPIGGFPYKDLSRIISVGYRPPPKGQDDRHEGVDFCFYHWKDQGGIEGRGVQSVLPGWITTALDGTFPYGSFVIVETPASLLPPDLTEKLKISADESLYTLYAHLQNQSLKVRLGQQVASCQILGLVGRTGNTTAPHLHFETRIGPQGARFEGMSNFVDSATDEERKNYRLWRISGSYNHFDPMLLLMYQVEGE